MKGLRDTFSGRKKPDSVPVTRDAASAKGPERAHTPESDEKEIKELLKTWSPDIRKGVEKFLDDFHKGAPEKRGAYIGDVMKAVRAADPENGPEGLRDAVGTIADLQRKLGGGGDGRDTQTAKMMQAADRVVAEAKNRVAKGGKPMDQEELIRMVQKELGNVSVMNPMKTYGPLWTVRPVSETILSYLDLSVVALIGQYVIRAAGTSVGADVAVGLGTPAYIAACIIAAPFVIWNMNTKSSILKKFAEGTSARLLPRRTGDYMKLLLRAGALAMVAVPTAGLPVKEGQTMLESMQTAGTLGQPPQKFLETIQAQKERQPAYSKAVASVEDFALKMEKGRFDPVQKRYVQWSAEEKDQMRAEFTRSLQAGNFSQEDINFYLTNITGSGRPGEGPVSAFDQTLLTGTYDPKNAGKPSIQLALEARQKAGIGANERLSEAVSRVMNEFLSSPELTKILDDSQRVSDIARNVEAQGRNPLLVLGQLLIGAAPSDVGMMAPLLESIRKQSDAIAKLSDEKVGARLTRMYALLNDAAKSANVPGFRLKAPGTFSIDTSALSPLDTLLSQQSAERAAQSVAAETQWSVVNALANQMYSQFAITDEKITATADLVGSFAGKPVADHIRQWGRYDSWAIALSLMFLVTGASAIPVAARGRKIRKAEPAARERLKSDEDKTAGHFANVLNEALKSIPGRSGQAEFPLIMPDLVGIAIRTLRDKRHPELEGKQGILRGVFHGVQDALQKGPIPDIAERNEALRKTLRDLRKDPRAIRELIDIILPGCFDGLEASQKVFKAENKKWWRPSEKQLKQLLADRINEADRTLLGHLNFRTGVLEAQERALAALKEELILAGNRKQESSFEKTARNELNMLDRNGWPKMSGPYADFLTRISIIEREAYDIQGALEGYKKDARRLTSKVVVDAKPTGRGVPQAFIISSPRLTADPYAVLSIVRSGVESDIKRRTDAVHDSAKPVSEKLNSIGAAAGRLIQEYRGKYPEYSPDFTRVYNNDDERMEFRLTIRDSKTREVMSERSLVDSFLVPDFSAERAAQGVAKWVRKELKSHERSGIGETLKEFLEPRDVRVEPILLSGRDPKNMMTAMRVSLKNYYEDKVANQQRELVQKLGTSVNRMNNADQMRVLRNIERADLTGTGVPSRKSVEAFCRNVLSMDIPPTCEARYELKTHEFVLSHVPPSVAARMLSPKKDVRIPIDSYSREAFESAVRSFR